MKYELRNKYYWSSSDSHEHYHNNQHGNMNNEESESNLVDVVDNRIYFYSEVTRDSIYELNKHIKGLDGHIQTDSILHETEHMPIKIHINSFGGSVFDALSTVDYIKNCVVPVHTIIDGCAASAATLISVASDKRIMYKNSFMLIHELSSFMMGKYSEMKDEIRNCDMLMDTIKNIYKEHTKIPTKKINEILKHDIWFSSKECLEYGLVDQII